jgi:hypothetical protein
MYVNIVCVNNAIIYIIFIMKKQNDLITLVLLWCYSQFSIDFDVWKLKNFIRHCKYLLKYKLDNVYNII